MSMKEPIRAMEVRMTIVLAMHLPPSSLQQHLHAMFDAPMRTMMGQMQLHPVVRMARTMYMASKMTCTMDQI